MRFWSRMASAFNAEAPAAPGPQFSIGIGNFVDPAVFSLTAQTDPLTPEAPVSRSEAMQVPAVIRGREMLTGIVARLPLYAMNAGSFERDFSRSLLNQPERNFPRSVTLAMTVEDMLFYGRAWWRITERDFSGRPTYVVRLDGSSVGVNEVGRVYIRRRDGASQGLAYEWPEDRDLIRIDSLNPDGLLRAGARAIRTCARLDAAASARATSPLPTGYFTTVDGAEPMWAGDILEGESEEEYAARAATAKAEFLTDWATARQGSATAFIPAGLVYNVVQESARDTQLAEERQHAVLEIARCLGVDAEFLNANPPGDSNTYANVQDKKLDRLDTVAEYLVAIADRLSMEDVTPRGTVVRFDTTGFLQADEKSRMEAYLAARAAGAYGPDEVRRREELPASAAPEPTQPAATVRPLRALPSSQEDQMAATADGTLTLDADASTFGFETDEGRLAFEVDQERRTIFGLAVPFGVVARKNGRRFQFSRGSLVLPADPSRVKLLVQHDRSQAVGRAVEFSEDDSGLWAKFKVARGAEGDRALAMAADGVWDGLSVGLDAEAHFQADRAGVHHLAPRGGPLREVSLTPDPAYDDARVSAVAAQADDPRGNTMSGNETGTETSAPATEPDTATQPAAPTFDAEQAAQFQAFQAWQAGQGGQEAETFHVPAAGNVVIEVNEESPYRFEAGRGFTTGGQFDFSADLKRSAAGDYAATQRVLGFMAPAFEAAEQGVTFDIDSSDGSTLNPSRNRPDLYVGQRKYQYPLWNAVQKETIKDKTPLVLPVRNTSTINVAAHTEGVEPTGASATWTSQTITPGAVSGKVEITRELWDQGGNPRVSNLIWGEMVDRYYEALEAKVVTTLDAASPTSLGSLTTGGGTTGQTLSAELAAAFASLQYIRGGFSMDTFAAQIDLYKALVGALDGDKRPLFPILNPTNANGQATPRFGQINVHGVTAFPAWALAATGTVAASSYLFDKEDVWGAASAPERLEFQYRVAYVDLAIWGYSAVAITDLTGVREVIYDPA